jgi:hypothetical protein
MQKHNDIVAAIFLTIVILALVSGAAMEIKKGKFGDQRGGSAPFL